MAKLASDIDRQIERAMTEANDLRDDEVATSVGYIASDDLFLLVLKSGRRVAIPREDIQDVAALTPGEAAQVAVVEQGTVVEWGNSNIDLGVKGLAEGRYGNERWMAGLGDRRRRNAA